MLSFKRVRCETCGLIVSKSTFYEKHKNGYCNKNPNSVGKLAKPYLSEITQRTIAIDVGDSKKEIDSTTLCKNCNCKVSWASYFDKHKNGGCLKTPLVVAELSQRKCTVFQSEKRIRRSADNDNINIVQSG